MKKLIYFFIGAMLSGNIYAQTEPLQRTCGTMEVLERQLNENPQMGAEMELIEEQIQKFAAGGGSPRAVITIPVVFHVVYENSTENISDQRLLDQLTVLNRDFGKTNPDTNKVPTVWKDVAADCQIQFCLAQKDPLGDTTTGITRTSTTVTSFSTDDKVKFTAQGGKDAWDKNKYLNIWVCDLGSGLLGYAQFPGGPAATDGIVIHYKYTGTTGAAAPYNKGRTATHEVGHWLNLRHIWGDDGGGCSGSDGVSDTPNQADETTGCPGAGSTRISCNNGPAGDMWMNYMDYSDDACMYMFTNGQKTRMLGILNGSRASLKSSDACLAPPVANFKVSRDTIAMGDTIDFSDYSLHNPTSWYWTFQGGTPDTSIVQDPAGIIFATEGCYDVQLIVTNAFGSDTATKSCYITARDYTGIKKERLKERLKLYPNPNAGLFTIELTGKNKNISYAIFNMLGEMVETKNLNKGRNSYSINIDVPEGIYFIELTDGDDKFIEKVIITK